MIRRLAALLGFLLLLFELLRRDFAGEVSSRVGILRRFGGQDLRTRRLMGTAAAYDRRFFEFIERARSVLPPGTPGLALYAPGIPEWGGLYLAVYHLAPLPVQIAPEHPPEGFLAAVYGAPPPPGWHVRTQLPHGALLSRDP